MIIKCALILIVFGCVQCIPFNNNHPLIRIPRQDGFQYNSDGNFGSSLANDNYNNMFSSFQHGQRGQHRRTSRRPHPQFQEQQYYQQQQQYAEQQIQPYDFPSYPDQQQQQPQLQPQQPQYQPIVGGIDYIPNTPANNNANNNGFYNENGQQVFPTQQNLDQPLGSIDLSNPNRATPYGGGENFNSEQLTAASAFTPFISTPSQQLINFPQHTHNNNNDNNNKGFDKVEEFGLSNDNNRYPYLYIDRHGIFRVVNSVYDESNSRDNINHNNNNDDRFNSVVVPETDSESITFTDRLGTGNDQKYVGIQPTNDGYYYSGDLPVFT